MLDTAIFIVSPVVLSAAMSWTFNRGVLAFGLLLLGSVMGVLFFSHLYPDLVTLRNPVVGAVHGVETWSFPYAAGATGGIVAMVRAVGLSSRVAIAAGAVACLCVTSAGCWVA